MQFLTVVSCFIVVMLASTEGYRPKLIVDARRPNTGLIQKPKTGRGPPPAGRCPEGQEPARGRENLSEVYCAKDGSLYTKAVPAQGCHCPAGQYKSDTLQKCIPVHYCHPQSASNDQKKAEDISKSIETAEEQPDDIPQEDSDEIVESDTPSSGFKPLMNATTLSGSSDNGADTTTTTVADELKSVKKNHQSYLDFHRNGPRPDPSAPPAGECPEGQEPARGRENLSEVYCAKDGSLYTKAVPAQGCHCPAGQYKSDTLQKCIPVHYCHAQSESDNGDESADDLSSEVSDQDEARTTTETSDRPKNLTPARKELVKLLSPIVKKFKQSPNGKHSLIKLLRFLRIIMRPRLQATTGAPSAPPATEKVIAVATPGSDRYFDVQEDFDVPGQSEITEDKVVSAELKTAEELSSELKTAEEPDSEDSKSNCLEGEIPVNGRENYRIDVFCSKNGKLYTKSIAADGCLCPPGAYRSQDSSKCVPLHYCKEQPDAEEISEELKTAEEISSELKTAEEPSSKEGQQSTCPEGGIAVNGQVNRNEIFCGKNGVIYTRPVSVNGCLCPIGQYRSQDLSKCLPLHYCKAQPDAEEISGELKTAEEISSELKTAEELSSKEGQQSPCPEGGIAVNGQANRNEIFCGKNGVIYTRPVSVNGCLCPIRQYRSQDLSKCLPLHYCKPQPDEVDDPNTAEEISGELKTAEEISSELKTAEEPSSELEPNEGGLGADATGTTIHLMDSNEGQESACPDGGIAVNGQANRNEIFCGKNGDIYTRPVSVNGCLCPIGQYRSQDLSKCVPVHYCKSQADENVKSPEEPIPTEAVSRRTCTKFEHEVVASYEFEPICDKQIGKPESVLVMNGKCVCNKGLLRSDGNCLNQIECHFRVELDRHLPSHGGRKL